LKQRAFKEKKVIDDAQKLAKKVNELQLKILAKTGGGNKLFGSISNADLAEALTKEGIEIEKKFITVPGGTIKRLGHYEATVRFHREVLATASFDVIEEKA